MNTIAAKNAQRGEEQRGRDDVEHRLAEQPQRQDRLRRAALLGDERGEQHDGGDGEPDDLGRVPRVLAPAPRRDEQQRRSAPPASSAAPSVVDPRAPALGRQVQRGVAMSVSATAPIGRLT